MDSEPDVRLVEDFFDEHRALFETLRDGIPWEGSMSARLTASFGHPYNYAQMVYPETPMHEALLPLLDRLEAALAIRFNNCLLNYYPDGRSKMGFHSDDVSDLQPDTGVAIVSLGSPRRITFRRRDDIETRWARTLTPGSLLFMEHPVQAEWAHAIKRQRNASPRISVTCRAFRRKTAPV